MAAAKGQTLTALLLLLTFDVLGTDRLAVRDLIQGTTTVEAVLENYGQKRGPSLLTGDFAELDAAVATLRAVHDTGTYNWGAQYLRLLIWPIPRQIWPNKPVNTDLVDFPGYSRIFNIITRTIVGDTYSNFGTLCCCTWLYSLFTRPLSYSQACGVKLEVHLRSLFILK